MNKSYYAIIPANVRYDAELTPNAKLLYGEITALCNEKGYCWAGNAYFAELYGVSKVSISKWVGSLIEQGYVVSDMQYKEGSKEILHRYLRIVNTPIKEKFNTPLTKVKEPIKEKFKDNNTFNNTTNNTSNKDIVGQPDHAPYKDVIDYLNQKTGKQFRKNTSSTQRIIKARFKEGFTLEDFKKVIDTKTDEWINDKKMSEYLRPQTLFGADKFEGYLNQKSKAKQAPAADRYDLEHLTGRREPSERYATDFGANDAENEDDFPF